MVRVFVPAAGGETPFAGTVEHVGTAWSARFGSDQELLAAVRSRLEREPDSVHAVVKGARTR